MAHDERRDSRESDKAVITVRGNDLKGNAFEEQTEIIDISSLGISFYLRSTISPRFSCPLNWARANYLVIVGKSPP